MNIKLAESKALPVGASGLEVATSIDDPDTGQTICTSWGCREPYACPPCPETCVEIVDAYQVVYTCN